MAQTNGIYDNFVLDNGLDVTMQKTSTKTAFAFLRTNFGSSHEEEGEEGLVHLLEHCLVNAGTDKLSPTEFAKYRDSFGGDFNVATSIGRTFFQLDLLKEDFESALNFLSQIVFCPNFNSKMVETQKQVVLIETSDNKGTASFTDSKRFREALYRGHPINYDGLGKEQIIRKATIEDLNKLHGRGFSPNNIELFLVGALPDDVKELVNKYFGPYKPRKDTRREFPELSPLEKQTIIHSFAPDLLNKDNPQTSSAEISFGFVVPPELKYGYPLNLISGILTGGTDSRLYKKIRSQKGLAYSIKSDYSSEYNAGTFLIQTNVPATKYEKVIEYLFEGLNELKKEKVDASELNRLIKITKFKVASQFETNMGHIQEMTRIKDHGITMDEILRTYQSITPEQIQETAIQYIPDKDENYVLLIRNPLKFH